MLPNYKLLPNGVIQQIDRKPFVYGYDYSNNYNKLNELQKRMSHLRLGFLLGAIGSIPSSILDVGYGSGDFLDVCKSIIPECYGSDVTQEYPLPETVKFLDSEQMYQTPVDVVCFFDVLEHFHDIYDIQKLKTDYIYVSLPWCEYKSDEWFESWKHRKPDEHLWFFNKDSLCKFFDEIGYDLITSSNLEDIIRHDSDNTPNILSAVFKRR